ncbi:MAG: glycosyltransferase family 4 protein [Candidatus Sericytochromatia bacterium]|nr:glycosyltransferase family 4 protein [Candidatus Sericytochromatia bacterium]
MIVEIMGNFFSNHSLAIINRNIAIELDKYVDVFIHPLDKYDQSYKLSINVVNKLNELQNKPKLIPDLQIRHSYPPLWRWPESKKTKVVFIQPIENTRILFEWQYKFETFADHVITISDWCANIFIEAGLNPEKISVMYPGFNPELFNTNNRFDSETFRFIYIGGIVYRKGIDLLLNAWKKTFTKQDNVHLMIKDTPQVYGKSNLPEIINQMNNSGYAQANILSDIKSEDEMAQLYKNSDVIVHPYRAEGFGMHIQEAMSCGCIPLVSEGGPTDEFVKDYKINTKKVSVSNDLQKSGLINPGDSLAMMGSYEQILEPDINDLSNKMRYLFENRSKILIDKSNLSTWQVSGERLYKILTMIQSKNSTKLTNRE